MNESGQPAYGLGTNPATPITVSVTYLPVVSISTAPDAFEPDDACVEAKPIAPGESQTHTFASLTHPVDVDYVHLTFAQPGMYDARTAAIGKQASPVVNILLKCDAQPFDRFTPGAPIRLVVPSANYEIVLSAENVAGLTATMTSDTHYRISISNRIVNVAAVDASGQTAEHVRTIVLPAKPISTFTSTSIP